MALARNTDLPITIQLVVHDAPAAIAFLRATFDAELVDHELGAYGRVVHARLAIGAGTLFVAEATSFAHPTSSNLYVYVVDIDVTYARGLAAGARSVVPPANMPWGDRWSMIVDRFGTVWQLATRITKDLA